VLLITISDQFVALCLKTHLVCRVPQYHPADATPLRQAKEVQVVVHSNGRASEPVPFLYVPGMITLSEPYFYIFYNLCGSDAEAPSC